MTTPRPPSSSKTGSQAFHPKSRALGSLLLQFFSYLFCLCFSFLCRSSLFPNAFFSGVISRFPGSLPEAQNLVQRLLIFKATNFFPLTGRRAFFSLVRIFSSAVGIGSSLGPLFLFSYLKLFSDLRANFEGEFFHFCLRALNGQRFPLQ